MSIKRAFKISTILIIVLLVVSAAAFLLDYLKVLPVAGLLQKVPVVGKLAGKQEVAAKSTEELIREAVAEAKKNSAAEVDRYKKKVGEMDQQSGIISKENELLEAKSRGLQTKVDELQAWKTQQEQQNAVNTNYPKLASYYAEMKPAKAAEIMKNQSDEMNVGILKNLEGDQVAKILSAMEPSTAARLVELIGGKQQ